MGRASRVTIAGKRLNVTATNMLAAARKHGGVPKAKVSPGGRYHVALMDAVRAGYAELADGVFRVTAAGAAYLDGTELRDGADARSRMKLKGG